MIPRAIHQFHPQVRRNDAIGNELFAVQQFLTSRGIESRIFCDVWDTDLAHQVEPWTSHSVSGPLLIHYSHHALLFRDIFGSKGRKVLVYHGITPPRYLEGLRQGLSTASEKGLSELPEFAGCVDYALADSKFLADELCSFGFRNVAVVPYVLHEPLYRVQPDNAILDRYHGDGWTNLLVVGRMVPNKCLEDCILVFDYFKRNVEPRSRLFLVGSFQGSEAYHERLQRLIGKLDLQDVFFTGSVPQSALISYYQLAHAYLCMSEHEGFCVPLVEAMRFDVPVIAYGAGAVRETLRGSGVQVKEKSWPVIAEAVGALISDISWRERVLSGQREQVTFYRAEAAEDRLAKVLSTLSLI